MSVSGGPARRDDAGEAVRREAHEAEQVGVEGLGEGLAGTGQAVGHRPGRKGVVGDRLAGERREDEAVGAEPARVGELCVPVVREPQPMCRGDFCGAGTPVAA
ncbi:hypothetical protein ACRAWC_22710 [Leifsonia sp. L25]|uniref:hypothetical protein n=1 Tax=Leifsonia sp. L25 TaxID=3423957 RepID=UPI003D69F554